MPNAISTALSGSLSNKNLNGSLSFDEFRAVNCFLAESEDFETTQNDDDYKIDLSQFQKSVDKFNADQKCSISSQTVETLYKVMDHDGVVKRKLFY